MVLSCLCLLGQCYRKGNPKTEYQLRVREDFTETVTLLEAQEALAFPRAARLADTLRTYLIDNKPAPSFRGADGVQLRNALRFLYAYMPLNDLAELPFEYYLKQAREALRTKDLPWGRHIPEEIFRHYVLPPRVNNEQLDNAREIFYKELYPRVKDSTMYGAVIEINHWCREKVLYQPTDARTTPPVHTTLRGYGRCGEESVVAVAALRSVGIPARQVYVPRWAHTDDNHAWVEVWVDGRWYYLGACEPEPELNRGWFTGPASRALLINTWAFGPLEDAQAISSNRCYTEVSSVANYAPVKQACVQVLSAQGLPVEGAQIRFGLYNYAEFYPLATRTSNAQGTAALTVGLGTLLVEVCAPVEGLAASVARASSVDRVLYAARVFDVSLTDTLKVVLEGDERVVSATEGSRVKDYLLVPPAQTAEQTDLTPGQAALHNARCAYDDSVRVSRQMPEPYRTNAADIQMALDKYGELGRQLVNQLRPKDRQEVPASTLEDYAEGVLRLGAVYEDTPLYRDYVLNPRVNNEPPLPYKALLWQVLERHGMTAAGENPQTLAAVRRVLDALVCVPDRNPRNFAASPAATVRLGLTDPLSRDICGVALYRTAGIPARIDPVSGRFEAWIGGDWQAVTPKTDGESVAPGIVAGYDLQAIPAQARGQLTVTCDLQPLPAYDSQYTLQRWNEQEGAYRTLGLSAESGGADGVAVLNVPLSLDAGYYRLITGVRLADGSVAARVRSFELPAEGRVQVPLDFSAITGKLQVVAQEDLSFVQPAVGRCLCVVVLLDATQEPSQHFIREFASLPSPLPVPVVFAFPDNASLERFHQQEYGLSAEGTPGSPVFLSEIPEALAHYVKPAVFLVDEYNKVYFMAEGYRIGVPGQLSLLPYPLF